MQKELRMQELIFHLSDFAVIFHKGPLSLASIMNGLRKPYTHERQRCEMCGWVNVWMDGLVFEWLVDLVCVWMDGG